MRFYPLQLLRFSTGATYDAIEGQFRKIRNGAKELRAKVEAGEVPVAPPRGAKSNPNTPRKPSAAPRDKTIGGRISKSANATPTKKGKGTKEIKEETTESSASSFYESSAEDITNWNASQPVVESEEFNYYFPNGNMEEDL